MEKRRPKPLITRKDPVVKHDLEKMYPENFFAKREWLRGRSRDLVRISKEMFDPQTTIDLGCGAGDLTETFLKNDVDAYGLEGSDTCRRELLFPQDRLIIQDLRMPFQHDRRYDLLTCLEVAEHIEPQFVDQFIKNLAQFSDMWLMSINPQRGKYHFTVKPFHWWAGKIESLTNVKYREDVVYDFRRQLNWLHRASNIRMILDNLLFFCTDEAYGNIFLDRRQK